MRLLETNVSGLSPSFNSLIDGLPLFVTVEHLSFFAFVSHPGMSRPQMTFMKLDLSSLESVRAFVAEFKASKLGLDSLVLNAGVMHSVSVNVTRIMSRPRRDP